MKVFYRVELDIFDGKELHDFLVVFHIDSLLRLFALIVNLEIAH